jgi:hypothetical protein
MPYSAPTYTTAADAAILANLSTTALEAAFGGLCELAGDLWAEYAALRAEGIPIGTTWDARDRHDAVNAAALRVAEELGRREAVGIHRVAPWDLVAA